jgi:hypothetical protein
MDVLERPVYMWATCDPSDRTAGSGSAEVSSGEIGIRGDAATAEPINRAKGSANPPTKFPRSST